ncbi:PEP/pyruvate-binding domain-containing protein [Massilia glaciei]|uniref:Phosphoenolpyruvate synthase n=1 Tax=Massilia glaciei TaxID=1524097 RepID=A0A2U2H9V8_9BURK|nr:PEP/pyruvate-binding domain-containing protein [Massilia glaciei]PWF39448.1 hypothetical protein C7C56_026995 [Massilia glaciei]
MKPASEHFVFIPNLAPAPVGEIGGKAHSLQRMAAAGLPVPPALVLGTGFFAPWFDALALLPGWRALAAGAPAQWPALCAALKAEALALPLTGAQRQALSAIHAQTLMSVTGQRYAVRSSSPEEDTAASSFAGVYETELGVAPGELEGAIRRCFASALDARVLAYKQARGVAPHQPRIAVIVQLQLDSEVAGVGFSINPLSNDYDEAVIDANWGLGESVVDGAAAADHFIVDKVTGAVQTRQLGAKQLAVVLADGGGTATRADARADEYCLSDSQLTELTAMLCRLEALYGHPVDMEWAYAGGKLFVLQARPITTWVPLPPEMMTAPGARRRLYMDIALSKGVTVNAPISPIGLDWMGGGIGQLVRHCFGGGGFELARPDGLMYLGGARMYINLSNLLWMCSPQQLARSNTATDKIMADILGAIDVPKYKSATRPAWRLAAMKAAPRALWRLRRPLWRALRHLLAPHGTHRLYLRECAAYEALYSGAHDDSVPLGEFERRYGAPSTASIIDVAMPALAMGILAQGAARMLARKNSPEELELAGRLTRGIGGNVVVDMGILIFRMARMLDAADYADLPALAARIGRRQMAPGFLDAWDRFMARFGCRGPGEMDLANAHYADDPLIVLRQMSFMATGGGDFDPEAMHARLKGEREQAYVALMERFGWFRRPLLRRVNTVIELCGGARDTPKHYNLMYQRALRARLLDEGRRLVQCGRLDRPEQIFELTAADLAGATRDDALDLRVRAGGRMRFFRLLADHVRNFPAVIDSRGRILRAPRPPERPGELVGIAVSPGRATGRVKILRNAHEKAIEKGDVLVAFTTDPGWTPLFVNAVAVVLEVGGVLQHGAVVAREYGKPCVVGIGDVLTRLHDGQMVEVDGTTGVVRIIS